MIVAMSVLHCPVLDLVAVSNADSSLLHGSCFLQNE